MGSEDVRAAAMIRDMAAEIRKLCAENAELMGAKWFIENQGYRKCDIPACNCPYWHGGNAHTRLREISDALESRSNGQTILAAVEELMRENADLRDQVQTMLRARNEG